MCDQLDALGGLAIDIGAENLVYAYLGGGRELTGHSPFNSAFSRYIRNFISCQALGSRRKLRWTLQRALWIPKRHLARKI